jgi:hypothetical protein
MYMRRVIAMIAVFGMLAAPAQAQDATADAEFLGSGPPVNTPFFKWDLTNVTGGMDNLGGETDFFCIDQRYLISNGETWEPGALFRISDLPPGAADLGYDLGKLNVVAGYYDYMKQYRALGGNNNTFLRSAQTAIWEAMGTLDGGNGVGSGTFLAAYNSGDVLGNTFTRPGGYRYMVMFQESDLANIAEGNFDGIRQAQFTGVAVPEPGVILLLSAGLLGLGLTGVRRRRFNA